jgi:hypothetical protein
LQLVLRTLDSYSARMSCSKPFGLAAFYHS